MKTATMDVLLEVLNERAVVASRHLPMLHSKTNGEVLSETARQWCEENLIRDLDGDLDWAGLIMAETVGALGEPDKVVQRRRLLAAAATIVAAIEDVDK